MHETRKPSAEDYTWLAEEAERRVMEAPTEDLREYWLREASRLWLLAQS